ncbi:hypothetical protein STEG23_032320, partial [Scotinomys teguina]
AVDKTHQNTPLHWAVAAGNVSAVDKLLEAGSSLDIRNAKVLATIIITSSSCFPFLRYVTGSFTDLLSTGQIIVPQHSRKMDYGPTSVR